MVKSSQTHHHRFRLCPLWEYSSRVRLHAGWYQKQFADAILAFMRETIPQEWTKFRDKVSDNFRVITHENFRVLK